MWIPPQRRSGAVSAAIAPTKSLGDLMHWAMRARAVISSRMTSSQRRHLTPTTSSVVSSMRLVIGSKCSKMSAASPPSVPCPALHFPFLLGFQASDGPRHRRPFTALGLPSPSVSHKFGRPSRGRTRLQGFGALAGRWTTASLERATGLAPVISCLGSRRVAPPPRPRILERPAGVAPASPRWKRGALLLSYGRISGGGGNRTLVLLAIGQGVYARIRRFCLAALEAPLARRPVCGLPAQVEDLRAQG